MRERPSNNAGECLLKCLRVAHAVGGVRRTARSRMIKRINNMNEKKKKNRQVYYINHVSVQ